MTDFVRCGGEWKGMQWDDSACKSDPEAAKENHLSNKGPNGFFYQHERGDCVLLEVRRRRRRCVRDRRRGLGKHPQATLEVNSTRVRQSTAKRSEGKGRPRTLLCIVKLIAGWIFSTP